MSFKFCVFKDSLRELATLYDGNLIFVVDEKLKQYFSASLGKLERDYPLWYAPEGENCKQLEHVGRCSHFFLEQNIHRKTHLVAIGGGATSDFAGFVASIMLRGLDWSVIPTTLLAMIDASIGGKTGINSKLGKNLLGRFHHPQNIYVDFGLLSTLSQRELNSGLGEMLKYCMLDKKIYDLVIHKAPMGDLIKACMNYKNQVIQRDFHELGERKYLNLGHSVGHALESCCGLVHGEAVALGLEFIMSFYAEDSLKVNFLKLKNRLMGQLKRADFRSSDLIEYIKRDKKRQQGDLIELVCLEDIGRPYLKLVKLSEIEKYLEDFRYGR
jgi:3-dehydroquinate synthetase